MAIHVLFYASLPKSIGNAAMTSSRTPKANRLVGVTLRFGSEVSLFLKMALMIDRLRSIPYDQ